MHPVRPISPPSLLRARHGLSLSLMASAALLAACMGGGGGDDTAAQPVALSGVVADGPLQGATVCLDLDDNGACDAGEPQSTTDADGKYSFSVRTDQSGAHAVVAQVPATAIDKDTGQAIGTALVMKAPATGTSGAQAVVVSPLTTVVADTAASRGISVAEAVAAVQAQLGLAASPLSDFTATGSDAGVGHAARAVGQVMLDTATLAATAKLDPAAAALLVRTAATTQLPVVATALAALPAEATVAERRAAASKAVADALNLSETTVTAVAQEMAKPAGNSDAAGPFVSVRRFTYKDANNYSYQIFTGDSSKTDASGAWTANEPRANVASGESIPFSRNQLYWTGKDWNNCDNGYAVVTTVAGTATTPQTSRYCDASKSESKTTWENIEGQNLRAVITRMRAYPLRDNVGSTTDDSGLPVNWGPRPELLPADAVFPAGAKYTTRLITSEIGNTDRIELAVKPTVRYADGVFRQATTLEQLGLMAGDLATAGTVVTNLNSLFVADVPLASQSDSTLQPFKRWRLAVDVAALKGRFYRCDVVVATGNSQSCEAMGDATLALQTQGGIRLLRVATGYPATLASRAQQQRFWAEHVGTVFRGTTDLERSYHDQRLNGPAWEALRTALNIPAHTEPQAPSTSGVFDTLRNFTFTDALNYSWRRFTGDSAVLDSEGYYTANEVRKTLAAGVDQPFVRNRAYWTGSTWLECPDGGPVSRTQAAAPFRSVYCGGFIDERIGNLNISLGGRLMSDVVNEIRSYASTDGGVSYSGWGPRVASFPVLSATRFPAGSVMQYRGYQAVATPETLSTDAANDRLRISPGATNTEPFSTWPLATTLEQVIAGYPGNLKGSTTMNGNTTLFVWSFTETPADPAYTNRVEIRVAFDADGNKARFTRNNRLVSNGLSTNYVTLLDTTYSIETVGGVRLLKFAALPEGFETRYGFTRRYGERNGAVWYAWKNTVSTTPDWSIRLNGTASQALRTALGIE